MAIEFIVGELTIRRGDRQPLIGLVVESDVGEPVDLTGAVCSMLLRPEDGEDALTVDHPGLAVRDGWLVLPAFVYDAPHGIVVYDWPQAETSNLAIGVMELVVEAVWPDGRRVTSPTARDARLVVRPPFVV